MTGLRDGAAGLEVAVVENLVFDDADPEVAAAVHGAAEVFAGLGAHLSHRVVPEFEEVQRLSQRYVINAVETYLQNEELVAAHGDELDPILGWITSGAAVAAVDYVRVLRLHADLKRRIAETLGDLEVLLMPATPIPALPLATVGAEPRLLCRALQGRSLRSAIRATCRSEICSAFAASLCHSGFTAAGLPIGLGLYAKPFAEALLLRAAQAYEMANGLAPAPPQPLLDQLRRAISVQPSLPANVIAKQRTAA